jgi:RNA ligase (TIGR02306 family)
MSSLRVEVVKIDNVLPHDNADRLELVQIKGWFLVSQKGNYKPGDLAIYLPIDSVLPQELEDQLFPPDSKIKLSGHRIKSIKIRGAISQGMLIPLSFIPESLQQEGKDVTSHLKITKYEPPEPQFGSIGSGTRASKRGKSSHPDFSKYIDIENFKNYNTEFSYGELVYCSEKIHGTSARYSWVIKQTNVLIRVWYWILLHLFKKDLRWEFLVGSRNIEVSSNPEDNVYAKIADQYKLREKIPKGFSLYGEIVGTNIQKNYAYGCVPGEHKLFVYDIKMKNRYLSYAAFALFCDDAGLPRVPFLYAGPFELEKIKAMTLGDSLIAGQKVREGVVIKPIKEEVSYKLGRKVLKYVSDEYLLHKNSDFH